MAGSTPSAPERWMTVRVYTNIMYTTGFWPDQAKGKTFALTEDDIDRWMRDCAEHGVTTVLWQGHCGGTAATHRGPVFDLPDPEHDGVEASHLDWWRMLSEQVRRFDTLDAAIAAAHRHGLRLGYSLCLWDYVDYGTRQNVLAGTWMTTADGRPLVGVPCYSDERAQERLLQAACDVLDRGVDDLAITFFTHAQGAGDNAPRVYGFNRPIVEAFEKQHGRPPNAGDGDAELRRQVMGDGFSQLIQRLGEQTRARGRRLIPCASFDGRWGWGGDGGQQLWNLTDDDGPPPTQAPGCEIELQWEKWAREGWADGLILFAPPSVSAELGSRMRQASGLPVMLWRKVNPGVTEQQYEAYEREAGEVRSGRLDGYIVHAMFLWMRYPGESVDYPPRLWKLIG